MRIASSTAPTLAIASLARVLFETRVSFLETQFNTCMFSLSNVSVSSARRITHPAWVRFSSLATPVLEFVFQKLKLGNNSVKSMPKYDASPVKKALKGDQDELPIELQNAIKAAPGKKYKNSHAKKLKSPSVAKKYKIPIIALGLGEKEDDLQIFEAEKFADAFTQIT